MTWKIKRQIQGFGKTFKTLYQANNYLIIV